MNYFIQTYPIFERHPEWTDGRDGVGSVEGNFLTDSFIVS